MSEIWNKDKSGSGGETAPEESFEELLGEYLSGPDEDYRTGDRITGRIISIQNEYAFVEFGSRSEGFIAINELVDENGDLTVSRGSEIALWIAKIDDDGIQLSRGLKFSGSDAKLLLRRAHENRIPIEGSVKAVNKGGFTVDIGGVQAFCPLGNIDIRFCENPESMIGLSARFIVTEYAEGGRRIVVSRRQLLQDEAREAAEKLRNSLRPGLVLQGTVSRILRFGAVIDLGGMEGLIPLKELSYKHIDNPADILKEGQAIEVQVLDHGKDDKGRDRVTLSLRALQPDPWELQLPFAVGQIVPGKVVRIEAFGAFIELAGGLEGLIHLSELSHERVSNPSKIVKIGQVITVKILDIDPPKRRIALSLKETISLSPKPELNLDIPGVETDGGSGKFGIFGKLLKDFPANKKGE
jgi:small subunit ribosomal protein S1